MVTVTGRDPRPQSRMDPTRAILARRRRNLLLPILLLVAVSLLAISALLYWSARSINERDAVAQDDLVRTVMQTRKDGLRQLVIDYAWWDDAVARFGTHLDERWARQDLPAYLHGTFRVAAGWVMTADGRPVFSFENGRPLAEESAPLPPPGSVELVAAARRATTIEEVPAAGFLLYQQDLALVAASPIAPLPNVPGQPARPDDVLVFVQPVDLGLFVRAGVGEHMENLHFLRGGVPPGYLGCEIKGIDGKVIGSVVWRDQRSGDDLLWKIAPLLLLALVAVCFLLLLAIKRVETVVSREGRLSISLYQEKQRRSQKADFVSMVSHELRTPLQAIGTAVDMLERFGDQMSEAERREETRTIRRAVGTLARLVDDVLVMGRAEAAAEGGDGEPLDLARLCRAVWREVSVALRAKQELVLQDGIGSPIYGGNAAALHAILSNLMQNAIKYSRGTGAVEVSLSRDESGYRITVTDQGPGVPPEEREAIFQPYWRSKRVDGIAGTGLGLPVARSAARSLGGELSVEDAGPGKGACFVVRWPASE